MDNRVTSFVPLVTREARKLAYGNNFTADDLIQEGILAAMSAMSSYDPGRGSMEGYIRVCARNRMISYLRRNGHESPTDDEALDAHMRAARPRGQSSHQEALEEREALYDLLGKLSAFETKVLEAYIRHGGVTDAAEAMGCPRKKVDNALQRVRNKARSL
jgi:RNA polymerase sigma factor (sigma-70 family)